MLEDKINLFKIGIAATVMSIGLYTTGCATVQKGAKDLYSEIKCHETYGPASERCNKETYPIVTIQFDFIPTE